MLYLGKEKIYPIFANGVMRLRGENVVDSRESHYAAVKTLHVMLEDQDFPSTKVRLGYCGEDKSRLRKEGRKELM
jgi:hypothetical protein